MHTRRWLVVALFTLVLGISLALPVAASAWTPADLRAFSQDEDRFLTYDFESASARLSNCDWPVTIVFWGHASVSKVKTALGSTLVLPGNAMYAYVSDAPQRKRPYVWASDRGVKSFSLTRALHVRLYADADGRLTNESWGDYVIATTHFDFNELSSDPTFGRSEEAAAAVEALCVTAWGAAAVVPDVLPLANVEADRVETSVSSGGGVTSHYWQCDGLATMVYVP